MPLSKRDFLKTGFLSIIAAPFIGGMKLPPAPSPVVAPPPPLPSDVNPVEIVANKISREQRYWREQIIKQYGSMDAYKAEQQRKMLVSFEEEYGIRGCDDGALRLMDDETRKKAEAFMMEYDEKLMKAKMMKIVVKFPKLNEPFKNIGGGDPSKNYSRESLPEIRRHWFDFRTAISSRGGVTIDERPLWQFDGDTYDPNVVYLIPHKCKTDGAFPPSCLFYAQTVFPNYFTIDPDGWGADLSFLSDKNFGKMSSLTTKKLSLAASARERTSSGNSKFSQPAIRGSISKTPYILFVCQIPHDEAIVRFSKVSVADALRDAIRLSRAVGIDLIVKGHPVNPGAMMPLWEIAAAAGVRWVDDISIHDCLTAPCVAAFMVNSGVGFEALLMGVPVYHYGRAEYAKVATFVTPGDLGDGWCPTPVVDAEVDIFVGSFLERCFDVKDFISFQQVEKLFLK